MSKEPIRVAVTGAAGQIGYALLFRIASGQMFGPDQPVALNLIEIEPGMAALEGVCMELDDCAFPLLTDVVATSDLNTGFNGANWSLLVGSVPRKDGMERGDLKVRLRVRGVGSELVLTTMRAGGVVAAAFTANKARLLLPGLVGTAFDYVVWGYSEALSFLSVHGFGRNTPEAKRQRAVARAQRQGRSAQRRAEREATQARQRRAKRRKAFWSPLTEPVRKKAKVAKEAWETA